MSALNIKQLIRKEDGPWVAMMGSVRTIRISGEVTGGALSLNEQIIAPLPALGSPLHMHEREDETFYILEGSLVFQVEDQLVEAKAGDTVWAPRGQRHAFWNPGPAPARILTLVTPAGFEQFFEELATPVESPEKAPPPSKPDPERMTTLARKYGLTLYPRDMLKV
ncbi:MAG TPA: cupin domain-containing protein [Symbiobacteriaceae bacterium]|nr:cupin domain-containing protein [Symbiobacteriaceae bacterium]